MNKKIDARCKGFTNKGERCKNLALSRGYCQIHGDQRQRSSIREDIPVVAAVISSSAALVILIEKLTKYWPDILYVLEAIVASVSFAGWHGQNSKKANDNRLINLKKLKVVGGFHRLAEILHDEDVLGRYLGKSKSHREKVPEELRCQILATLDQHQLALQKIATIQKNINNEMDKELNSTLALLKHNSSPHIYDLFRGQKFSQMVDRRNEFELELELQEDQIIEFRSKDMENFERDFPKGYSNVKDST